MRVNSSEGYSQGDRVLTSLGAWLGEEDVGVARTTKAQQIEKLNEQQAVVFFEGTLSALPDPRRRQAIRYPLRSIMVIALMAMAENFRIDVA
jgi:hypothetical protein